MSKKLEDIMKVIQALDADVRRVLERVLEAERAKLYMKSPQGITQDIEAIVKEEVKEA